MKITVFAKTNAKKNEVSLREDGLVVAVTAIPEKGKANKAIEKAIAKYYDVAPSCVRIIAGETAKHKIVEIIGDSFPNKKLL